MRPRREASARDCAVSTSNTFDANGAAGVAAPNHILDVSIVDRAQSAFDTGLDSWLSTLLVVYDLSAK